MPHPSVLGLAIGFCLVAAPGMAAPLEIHARYSASLIGLPLARAELAITVEGENYKARVSWRTVGLVGLVAAAHGDIAAEGRLSDRRLDPRRYTLDGTSGRRPSHVALTFTDHRVVTAEVAPPSKPSTDLVPLTDGHRRGVVDPLSAALLPTADGEPCGRTLAIFDGWSRYDVRLTPSTGRAPPARDGIAGQPVVCAARWIPIAGHRADHPNVRRMVDNRDIAVTFGRATAVGLRIPLHATASTPFGPAELTLDSLSSGPATPPASPSKTRPAGRAAGPDAGRKD